MAQHYGDADLRIDWGNMKAWARNNKVPDDALLEVSGFAVRDLDHYEAEDGQPSLFTLTPGERLYH